MFKKTVLLCVTLFFIIGMTGVFPVFTGEVQASTVLLEQDFQSPVGGVPDDWNVYFRGSSDPVHAEIREWVGADDHTPAYGWTNERIDSTGENAQIIYEGENHIFSDFEGEVLMQYNMSGTNHATHLGVYLRIQEDARSYSTGEGYFIGMIPGTGSAAAEYDEHALGLFKNPSGHGNIGGEILALDEENVPVGDTLHKMWFSAQGNTISARLYVWDEVANDFELASELSYTDEDSPYTSGLIGLRAGTENTNMEAAAQFANLVVIPEPSSLLLLGLAGLALLHRRRQ